MSLVSAVQDLTQRVAAALLDFYLPSVSQATAGQVPIGKMTMMTGTGDWLAPPLPSGPFTKLLPGFGVVNRTVRIQMISVPNPAGSVIVIAILPGASTTWRMEGSGYVAIGSKPQARLDERYRGDMEFWDRAIDHAPGPVLGEYAFTGQKIVPQGYTTGNASDPAAFPKYIGTGLNARISVDVNGAPLGVFHQAQLAGHVKHLRGVWTINPNTMNGGSTAGTANSGTIGLIAWQPSFNGNAAQLNAFSPCHLAVNPTGFQYGVIYDSGGGTPAFTNIYTHTYDTPLAQDGITQHTCEVFIDPLAPNDAGGRGLAIVYSPDGTIHRISNNAIGAVPTATLASFELYKANAAQKLVEFVEVGADSRRGFNFYSAVRELGQGRSNKRVRLTCSAPGVTTTGTITKPVGAKIAHITMWAGGGGGGSGGIAATTAAQSGGSGGAGSAALDAWVDAADLPASIAYQVGAGGAGGAAKSPSITASGGNAGTAGAASFLGALITTYGLGVNGAGAGAAAVSGTATGGAVTAATNVATLGTGGGAGNNGAAGSAGGITGNSKGSGGGGGGGGLAATTQAVLAGGAGGYITGNPVTGTGGTSGTPAGGTGANAITPTGGGPANGGGGGASQTSGTTPGTGGAGGFPGGGGGGGGSASNNNASSGGAGGKGGDGLIIVDWIF